jgi:hypothetical protein
MTAEPDPLTLERETVKQCADWYRQQGYEVALKPPARELPEFLRALAPDLVARRDGENIVVEIKTSSPASFERVQHLARALEHRAGWTLQVVYADLPDPEWEPPSELAGALGLLARLEGLELPDGDGDEALKQYLLLWSIIQSAARHRLSAWKVVPPTGRISSSALIQLLLTEGVIEESDYELLRRGLAARNAIAHGFLNQPVGAELFAELRKRARRLLRRPEFGVRQAGAE